MAEIELRLMGDFAVLRDGQSQKLPPSKKTRALLAYLSLNARRFRRERLCELLWEIPDDPKGSVRWSLSKLRRLIDDADRPRIVADRVNVSIRSEDLAIDVVELRTLAGGDLTNEKLEAIETAATQFNGNFLEGLEFPNFHDFHTWCVAERAQALRDRGALLTELISRYADVPDQALPHARVLVGLSPYDETNRATLIRLLYAAGQPLEAEQQFQLGLRMLREVGATPSGALDAARRGPRIDMPRVEPTPERIPEPPLPEVGKGALVGREQEVTQLIQTMDAVRQTQQAAVVLIRGAPGIGKSRVLEVALDYAVRHDAMVCQATAFESDGLRPFSVWIDALRSADTEQYDRIFGNAVGNADRDQLFASLSGVVASHAAERLVVLVFDDMHWSDESSAAALHYVARMNRNSSVVAILAARGGELRDNAPVQQALRGLRREGLLQEIRLGPLADDALLSLIAEQAPDADKERLSRECGGNPLLAIELARAEIEGAGSGSLKELIRERLERFTVTGREVIHWAALLRPRIDVPTIVRITGLDAADVGEVFEVAERNGMLLPGSKALRFPHDLVAQAVYTDISPLRRQVMHRRIAELLEQDTALDLAQASDLAHHAMQSGDPGLAARAMVSAGRLCLRFFANEEALSLARKGLVFAEQLDGAACVMAKVDLNDVILSAGPTGDWEAAAAEHLVGLAESALDHGALVHARLGYQMASYVRWAQGDWNAAREQSLQAERVTRGADNEEHVIGMAETAKCLVMLERDLTRADALLMEAEALADRRQFMHHAIHAGLGMLRYHENRLDEAEECFQQSRTLCKSAGDRINEFLANEYLVMIDLQRGRLQEARNRSEQLASLGEKIREGSEKPFAYALIGLCDYALGDPAKTLNAALEDLRLADAKYRLAYLLTRAALIDCERGEPQSASVRAQEALGYASILQRPTETLLAHAVLAYTNDAAETQAESARHGEEVDRLQPEAAVWAKDIATRLAALV